MSKLWQKFAFSKRVGGRKNLLKQLYLVSKQLSKITKYKRCKNVVDINPCEVIPCTLKNY